MNKSFSDEIRLVVQFSCDFKDFFSGRVFNPWTVVKNFIYSSSGYFANAAISLIVTAIHILLLFLLKSNKIRPEIQGSN